MTAVDAGEIAEGTLRRELEELGRCGTQGQDAPKLRGALLGLGGRKFT